MAAEVSLASLHTDEVRRDPYPFYAELHRHGPVCRVEPGDRYSYVVHGYDAAAQVLRDSATFKVMDETLLGAKPSWEGNRAHAVFMNSVFFTNAPRHTRLRRMFNQTFTPRRIAALEPAVERLTADLLDRLAEQAAGGAKVDFMSEFAFPLPANVLGELLGVPEADRAWYRPRALALGAILELGGATPDNVAAANTASEEITAYFGELAALRRRDPRDDLITALVQATDADGAPMSEEELLANLIVVFNAGFVTTTHLLGNGLTLLLERPEALARLRADASLTPRYVEEILRYEVPTHFSVRWAAADSEVAGVPIPAGCWVLVLLAAANRDPARFAHPDTFDPDRTETATLSFGGGAHYCLGAALARLEGQRGLAMLLDRFGDIRLAAPPGTPRQLMLRGHEQLWLTLA
ncbi:cytochrome P450 [Catellatospora bangladeshensis]|uniref:Cytochrome P450 n=1 Tax=Catellatospora bangladeshensis TaxID=310355 RepID=A0A8J3NHV2_9ACTN|nr:cytochrome P450 [Catellatospora bangladeshensis]GIF78680.1 cytochrome P450 [Catellatospora bangladeshensis]